MKRLDNEKQVISILHEMAVESLSPEIFKKWEVVKNALELTRTGLIQQASVKTPIVVNPFSCADDMNKLHGESYGFDWEYDHTQPTRTELNSHE